MPACWRITHGVFIRRYGYPFLKNLIHSSASRRIRHRAISPAFFMAGKSRGFPQPAVRQPLKRSPRNAMLMLHPAATLHNTIQTMGWGQVE
ncbi:MAG: hypothetical protein D6719_03770 [Candidatus Dadabacteria bacterium]|nr:MAG: hypothetical protein D6719_03770 [Candidatus Dadabacteria bacterium]